MTRNATVRKGFTLIELMAVVLILAILAGVALPKFFNYSAQAKVASCKGALGGMRAGIANFYADQVITIGTAAYPTLAQLTTITTVMQEALPANPYNNLNTVKVATAGEWAARTAPVAAGAGGWAYYVDNALVPPASGIYANTSTALVTENLF